MAAVPRGRIIFPKPHVKCDDSKKPVTEKDNNDVFEGLSVSLHRGLRDLWQEDMFTDFEIETKQKSFRCNKVVLASVSDYFKAMFSSGMQEAEMNKASFDDVSADSFQTFLNILYRTDEQNSPFSKKSDKEMADLYNLAIRLQIKFLEALCRHHFENTMNVENCIQRWKLGRIILCEEVSISDTAWEFIAKNLTDIAKDPFLLSLEFADFRLLIQDQTINVPNESVIWDIIKRWIEFDANNRKQHLEALLKECCVTQIDVDFLMEEMVFHPLVRENQTASQIVQEAIKLKKHRAAYANMEIKYRTCHGKDQSVVLLHKNCVNEQEGRVNQTAWNRLDQEWQSWAPLENGGHYTACCVHADSIFVLSGTTGAYRRATLWEFNGKTKRWSNHRDMMAPLIGHTMAAINGHVCVIGGISHHQQNLRVYKYSIEKQGPDPWSIAGEIMAPVMNASSVAIGSKIYIFGGEIDGMASDGIQVYDAEEKFGTIFSNLPKPCRWSRALCRGNTVYLVA